ncbi:MAG: AIM24 family protein [Clostridiaceae bacterium]|nr:AIM24 family protein [Clostridiaceae bacterium]
MLNYKIIGNAMQQVVVELGADQTIYSESGKFLWKTDNIKFETSFNVSDKKGHFEEKGGGGFMGKFMDTAVSVGKRKLAGESAAFQVFNLTRGDSGLVTFSQTIPGEIKALNIEDFGELFVQKDGFLAAENTVDFDIALTKKIGAGMFGGEGFILEKFSDKGTLFIGSCGNFIELNPADYGGKIQIDTGALVAFDKNIDYDIEWVGKDIGQVAKNLLFGGEGLFLATLSGNGRVLIQSMNITSLSRTLFRNAAKSSPEDRSSGKMLGGIGSLLGELGGDKY